MVQHAVLGTSSSQVSSLRSPSLNSTTAVTGSFPDSSIISDRFLANELNYLKNNIKAELVFLKRENVQSHEISHTNNTPPIQMILQCEISDLKHSLQSKMNDLNRKFNEKH
jgi:deoxyadenosine/deoxycytidine kinase